jgi:hypothetical protein
MLPGAGKMLRMKIKKLLLLLPIFLLIFAAIANAQSCDIDDVKQSLRKVLYLHFVQPQDNPLTLNEVIDLLAFYLSYRDEGTPTVDCSVSGARSNRKIEELVNEAFSSPSVIPMCIDGTQYGECSGTKPKYCYAGSLIEKCDTCGCSAGTCSTTGECITPAENITCSSDSDCGAGTFTGNYYCSSTYVMRNIVNYTCMNPGTAGSSCTSDVYSAVIDYCDPSLNEVCVDGAAACQTNTTTTNETSGACAVRNSYTGVPRADAPDIGTSELYNGYAKKMVPGVNDNNQLLALCTQTDYDYLMEKYCNTQDNSVQLQVWTFFEDGSPQSTGCAASGCEFHNCGENITQATCSWTADGICPSGCAAGSDADCCTQAGKFILMANLGDSPSSCAPGCYSTNYTLGTTPCLSCSGNISDGACPNWCVASSDADCF